MNEKEIQEVNTLISRLKPGRYELSEIYGEKWSEIKSPTSMGKRFKNAVVDGKIQGVKFDTRKTDNHSMYLLEMVK